MKLVELGKFLKTENFTEIVSEFALNVGLIRLSLLRRKANARNVS